MLVVLLTLTKVRPERYVFLFFFSSRRRHTRSLRDWSSDVCSSDLASSTSSAFEPARPSSALLGMPARFVVALLGAALLVLLASPWLRKRLPSGPQTIASRVGYPGLVLATGLGWLLLLDLSANGHFGNRYLALYHQGHLWLGMLTLTVVVFLRQWIGRALGWTLSLIDALASSIRRRVGSVVMTAGVVVLMIGLIGAVGGLLTNLPQLTSEIARLWLIVCASWVFFLRGDPLAERLARSGSSLVSMVRYVWPLLCIVLVLTGIQLITHDMGPLLIVGYGAGAFVAASIAMWWHQRSGASRAAFALAMALFVIWIFGITLALFELGALDAGRAALGRRLGSRRQRRSGAAFLVGCDVGRARALPARGDGGGQSRGAAAHRSDVSLRELRHDVLAREHGVARPRHQRQPAVTGGAWLKDARRRFSTSRSRRALRSCRCCSWCCFWSVWLARSIRWDRRRATAIATSACAKSPH